MTTSFEISPLPPSIGFNEFQKTQSRVAKSLANVLKSSIALKPSKSPPIFSTAQVAQACGVEKSRILYRLTKRDLSAGVITTPGARREWLLADFRLWVREYRKDYLRPSGAAGVTICFASLKEGGFKTNTVMSLAQGLSLRGHKVLIIDTDPQGKLTSRFGINPETDVVNNDTILPLYQGIEADLMFAVRQTYWDGIDIIAAASLLVQSEFVLQSQFAKNNQFEFWSVLDVGLDPIRDEYDVIIIDTPPTLSNSTVNALWAADGLVFPIVPNVTDFASSAQFWRSYCDCMFPLTESKGNSKQYSFINVLLTRIDGVGGIADEVRRGILSAYGDCVLPIEIPDAISQSGDSVQLGTVYDTSSDLSILRAVKRAHDAYERWVELMENQIRGIWAYQTKP